MVERGLCRSIALESVFFLPASVLLVLVVIRPLLLVSPVGFIFRSEAFRSSASGFLGVISYQFPFATVRRVITQMALHTLQKFASITINSE